MSSVLMPIHIGCGQIFSDMVRTISLEPIFLLIELLVSDHQLVEVFSLRIILLQFFILNSDAFFQNLVFVGEIFQVVLDARIFVQAGFV